MMYHGDSALCVNISSLASSFNFDNMPILESVALNLRIIPTSAIWPMLSAVRMSVLVGHMY